MSVRPLVCTGLFYRAGSGSFCFDARFASAVVSFVSDRVVFSLVSFTFACFMTLMVAVGRDLGLLVALRRPSFWSDRLFSSNRFCALFISRSYLVLRAVWPSIWLYSGGVSGLRGPDPGHCSFPGAVFRVSLSLFPCGPLYPPGCRAV